ncbi:hypothetical protein VQY18_02425 [Mycoplasma feriruminatoris]|uniref:Lipoprotein n=1 Tax=Mycoplasma feriruminatoris TaxID=1179777 RepID=A0A654IN99_9MOLU|nr:hypothetical protein MF5583_00491 [Mycoplasma feriruminatoris]
MKKILSFLTITISTILSSSLAVSCARNNTSNKTEEGNNVTNKGNNNLNSSMLKNQSYNPNKKENKENQIDQNNGSSYSKNGRNDQSIQSNKKPNKLSKEKESILDLLKDLSKKDEIINFAEELITKKKDFSSKKTKDKEWSEYSKKIENLFKERKYEKVKEELINLLKETKEITSDKKSIEDKLKTYKGWTVDEQLKEGLLLEFKFFFDSKFYITQEKKTQEAIKSFLEEINKLISEKNTNELKEKLFKLVDEISQLEKD